jgi:hypothetical protein
MEAKHLKSHHGMQSIPHHGNNKEGGSLNDPRVSRKCNGSPQESNLVHKVQEKISKGRRKGGMIGPAKSQAFALKPTQGLKHA